MASENGRVSGPVTVMKARAAGYPPSGNNTARHSQKQTLGYSAV